MIVDLLSHEQEISYLNEKIKVNNTHISVANRCVLLTEATSYGKRNHIEVFHVGERIEKRVSKNNVFFFLLIFHIFDQHLMTSICIENLS